MSDIIVGFIAIARKQETGKNCYFVNFFLLIMRMITSHFAYIVVHYCKVEKTKHELDQHFSEVHGHFEYVSVDTVYYQFTSIDCWSHLL